MIPVFSESRLESQGFASLFNGLSYGERRSLVGGGDGGGAAARMEIRGVGTGMCLQSRISPPPQDAKQLGSRPGPSPRFCLHSPPAPMPS